MIDYKQKIQAMFNDVFEKDEFDLTLVKKYFHPDYRQDVDGKVIDFDGFVAHLKALKIAIMNCKITFEKIIVEGNTVCTIHFPEADRRAGGHMKAKVIAVFTFEGEQLIACNELTHLVEGNEEDRDLGSRH